MTERVISCAAPFGKGGLGQHLAQLCDETQESNWRCHVLCSEGGLPHASVRALPVPGWEWRLLSVVNKLSPAGANAISGDLFDRRVAGILANGSGAPPDRFMGFVGKSLQSFRVARRLGAKLELVAANSHVHQVERQHRIAARDTGISDSWLGAKQIAKTLAEYREADLVYVHSDYTRDSMLDNGVDASKLVRTQLKVAARFTPPSEYLEDGVFRIVYVGRLDATKGVPLLIDAFKQLDIAESELRLVGGYPSRRLREACERMIGDDPRIVVRSGDPVAPIQRADVFVHPSYEDGFAYAPAEALSCGTPVVVTEDTGMKEHVREAQNGFVVPTGSREALIEAIRMIYRAPLKRLEPMLAEEARYGDTGQVAS